MPPAGSPLPVAVGTTPFRCSLVALLTFFAASYRDVSKMHAPPLHDPCAVFFALAPAAFTSTLCRVDVETASPLMYGRTQVDLWNVGGHSGGELNARVCTAMDVPSFWRAMLEAVAAADAVSPLNATTA